MAQTNTQNKIADMLSQLGLESHNNGVSTGNIHFGSGPKIESFSPVDGKLIGSVSSATREDFDQVKTNSTKEAQALMLNGFSLRIRLRI